MKTVLEEKALAAIDEYTKEWEAASAAATDPENKALFARFASITRNTRHRVWQVIQKAEG